VSTTNTDPATSNRLRNLRLAALIESWLQDESRDDERIGPLLDQFLAENPIRVGVHKGLISLEDNDDSRHPRPA
jgi:hypothetical protein